MACFPPAIAGLPGGRKARVGLGLKGRDGDGVILLEREATERRGREGEREREKERKTDRRNERKRARKLKKIHKEINKQRKNKCKEIVKNK